MERIIEHIRKWFDGKREYFEAFARNDTRLESWFKGELVVLLEKLKTQGLIDDFEREPNLPTDEGRKQIDFAVNIKGDRHFCELKAMCISQALGTPRNLGFYFRDDHVGVVRDFKKLDQLEGGNKWVLAFIYPRPSEGEWDGTISFMPESLRHWKCVTEIGDYPEYMFIALWRV